jgi:5-methyltetrahydropteroyltriglutamate--homocysteine methyltransferase
MLDSTDRILTTHAGSLPRPLDLRDMVLAKANGAPYDPAALDERLKSAVAEVVRRQAECGIDCVNDGEFSKTNFTDYVRGRIAGYEARPSSGPRRLSITARDETKLAAYFEAHPRARPIGPPTLPVCVDKLRYVGEADLTRDLDNFKAALAGNQCGGGLLTRQHPGHDRTLDDERILQER